MCSVISPASKNFGLLHQPTKTWGFIHLKKKYRKKTLRCSAETCSHFSWHNAALCFLQEFPFEFLLPCCCCLFIQSEKLLYIFQCDSHVPIWDFSLAELTAQSCQLTPGINAANLYMFLSFPGLFCRRMPQSSLEFPFPAHLLSFNKTLIVFWKEDNLLLLSSAGCTSCR